MAFRSNDADDLYKSVEPFMPIEGFYPYDWLLDERNIALTDGEGSYALFEFIREKVYYGHYFFQVKGRKALDFANNCLDEIFKTAEIVIGLTPKDNRPALWMNRQIGFRYMTDLETVAGPTEMFMKTRSDHYGHIRR